MSTNNTPSRSNSGGLTANRLSPSPSKGHQHSLSSGATTASGNHSAAAPNASFATAAASPNTQSQQKFRASMGVGANAMGSFPGKNSSNAGSNARPASELLSGSGIGNSASPETEAIDRWFEDLQHYEATLEEMAAASLDQNFKEELNAIEQWFRVLSEAERTAALYSLLQSSTQVQIRFFIQVLQQMARADPITALLSPSNPQSASMEAQMEAKLAAMGFKSPASPVVKQFARQSLGPSAEAANFLSPNDANAAALLAQQRAKLKAQSNRISAPGTLSHAAEALKSPLWSQASADSVAENRRSPSPAASSRPKSTGSDVGAQLANLNTSNGASINANMLRSPNVGNGMSFDTELSPMVGGNWSSMVNTPLVPMFTDAQADNLDLGGANSRLQGWGNQSQNAGPNTNNPNGIVLDDAKKFRRSTRADGIGLGQLPQSGVNLNGQAMGNFGLNNNRRLPSGASPQMRTSTLAASTNSQQAAALSAQANWRNVNGLMTPNSAATMSPQDMANALMQQQQMMQAQLQLQQNLIMGGMMGGLMSPNLGMNMGMGMPMNSPILSGTAKRSPRPGGNFNGFGSTGNRTPNSANNAHGSGANPDEVVDQKLLDDVPAWLRSLRLHKYTPNFEKVKWQDMVIMDDAALEAQGVSALGARRKLLKVFENVRIQKGMQEAGTEEHAGNESVASANEHGSRSTTPGVAHED